MPESLAQKVARTLEMAERHEICPDGDWIRWCRDTFNLPDLFLYYHKEAQTFVLAQWVTRDPPRCLELWAFEEHPGRVPPDREWLENLLRPASWHAAKVKQRIREETEMRRRLRQESRDERDRVANHFWRKGKEHEAMAVVAMGEGYTGRAEGGEEQERLERELNEIANGRIQG